jgi:predicted lipoprotein with Yx(FWY)xxD motif
VKRFYLTLVALTATAALAAGSSSATAATDSSAGTGTVRTAASSLGRILVDARRRTLYLFEKDRLGRSACAGTCATYWPPLLVRGKPAGAGGAKQSLLGSTRRADGTTQVTYAGHPLYRFVLDTGPGRTKGQDLHDFGAAWYVVSPSGKKIEKGTS